MILLQVVQLYILKALLLYRQAVLVRSLSTQFDLSVDMRLRVEWRCLLYRLPGQEGLINLNAMYFVPVTVVDKSIIASCCEVNIVIASF